MTPLVAQQPTGRRERIYVAIDDLRSIALGALKRMYVDERGLFAFRLRRGHRGDVLEGVSRRYSAIALIGLSNEDERVWTDILGGRSPHDVCLNLLNEIEHESDMGSVALTLWACRALNLNQADRARDRLLALKPWERPCPTVELAWCLAAASIDAKVGQIDATFAGQMAERLILSFSQATGLFPHWPSDLGHSSPRSHIACFADLVYPIQALAYYFTRTRHAQAIDVARRCADVLCSLQGADGQWWWHYDVRTGRIVEGYPVYAIHQDAMGPMALFDLKEACGAEHDEAVERSVNWLMNSPELEGAQPSRRGSLVDRQTGVIWRKVARREPAKLSRTLQALASRLHPRFRIPGLDLLFRPGAVDYESRPYQFGWLLYAWPLRRLKS